VCETSITGYVNTVHVYNRYNSYWTSGWSAITELYLERAMQCEFLSSGFNNTPSPHITATYIKKGKAIPVTGHEGP
jgi:hypothetical protein